MQHVVTSSVEIFFLSTQVDSDPQEFHQSPPKSLHVQNFIFHVILCPIIHNQKAILGFTLNNSMQASEISPFPLSVPCYQNTLENLNLNITFLFLVDPDEDVQPRHSTVMVIIQGELLDECTGEKENSSRPWKQKVAVHRE